MATAPKKRTRVKAHKPGWQTTEFWVTQLTIIGVVLSALDGVLPPKYAAMAVVISQAAYAIARGIAKMNRDRRATEQSETTIQTEGK